MRATGVLILLCVITSLASWFLEPAFVQYDLAFSLSNLLQGRVWTLVTALFVHASLIHLAGNMIFLYVFGGTVEAVKGSRGMLAVFFLGGVLSFIVSIPFFPANLTFVGASAAIFSLTAVALLVKPLKFSWILLMPIGAAAALFFLYNALAVIYDVQSEVAYVSHVIGFLIGAPFGIAWSSQWKRNLGISVGLLVLYAAFVYFVMRYVIPVLG